MTELRRALPFLLLPLVLLAAGCSLLPWDMPGATVPSDPPGRNAAAARDLADHRAAWTASGITTYRLELRFGCECAASGPVAVTVVDGAVTDVRTPDGADASSRYGAIPLTVDAMYRHAADALARGATVTVAYGDGGVPTAMNIDPIPNAVDDELGIEVLGFTPGP